MKYANEHFLKTFQGYIRLDGDDMIEEKPESFNVWNVARSFFGIYSEQEDIEARAEKW